MLFSATNYDDITIGYFNCSFLNDSKLNKNELLRNNTHENINNFIN
jgi:hypothetical protein